MRWYRLVFPILALAVVTAPLDAQRRGSRSSSGSVRVHGYTRRDGTYVPPYTRSTPRSYAAPSRPHSYSAPRSYSVPRKYSAPHQPRNNASPRSYRAPQPRSNGSRDANSGIHRSREARDEFLRRTGYPHGRSGYVVDHIVPLCAGGADAPSNMQWQTVEEGKAKDRQEQATCAARKP